MYVGIECNVFSEYVGIECNVFSVYVGIDVMYLVSMLV